MNIKTYTLIGLLVSANMTSWAQQPPRGGGGGASMPQHRGVPELLMENFFPPELVMRNQKTLGLTDDQSKAIREEMHKAMTKFTDLQWQQSTEAEALTDLLQQERVDETKTLAQLDKLLAVENEIKRLHFGSMLRIKNILTAEQQTKLRELKKQMRSTIAGLRGRNFDNPGQGGRGQQPRPPQENSEEK